MVKLSITWLLDEASQHEHEHEYTLWRALGSLNLGKEDIYNTYTLIEILTIILITKNERLITRLKHADEQVGGRTIVLHFFYFAERRAILR